MLTVADAFGNEQQGQAMGAAARSERSHVRVVVD